MPANTIHELISTNCDTMNTYEALVVRLAVALDVDPGDLEERYILDAIGDLKTRTRQGEEAMQSLQACYDYIYEDSPGKKRDSWRTASVRNADRSEMHVTRSPVVKYLKANRDNRLNKAMKRRNRAAAALPTRRPPSPPPRPGSPYNPKAMMKDWKPPVFSKPPPVLPSLDTPPSRRDLEFDETSTPPPCNIPFEEYPLQMLANTADAQPAEGLSASMLDEFMNDPGFQAMLQVAVDDHTRSLASPAGSVHLHA